jgi:hypothetical protein
MAPYPMMNDLLKLSNSHSKSRISAFVILMLEQLTAKENYILGALVYTENSAMKI